MTCASADQEKNISIAMASRFAKMVKIWYNQPS